MGYKKRNENVYNRKTSGDNDEVVGDNDGDSGADENGCNQGYGISNGGDYGVLRMMMILTVTLVKLLHVKRHGSFIRYPISSAYINEPYQMFLEGKTYK